MKKTLPRLTVSLGLVAPLAAGATALVLPLQTGVDNPVTVEPVDGSCYRLHKAGANMGLFLGWDGALIVDGGFLQAAPELDYHIATLWEEWWERSITELRRLAEESGAPAEEPQKPPSVPIRYVVTSHWHTDHVMANSWFGEAGATIVSHPTARRRVMGDPEMGEKVLAEPVEPAGIPVVTFEDSLTIEFNGEHVQVMHMPYAHTDGDLVVWLPESKVLFAGDVYRNGSFPYIELMTGARPSHLIAALERLLEMLPEDAVIVPGHGKNTDYAGLRAFYDMFVDCDRQIRQLVGRGGDLAEAYDLRMYGEYMDVWAAGEWKRVKGFLQVMWYCYAPEGSGGLGELDRERREAEAEAEAAGGGSSGR